MHPNDVCDRPPSQSQTWGTSGHVRMQTWHPITEAPAERALTSTPFRVSESLHSCHTTWLPPHTLHTLPACVPAVREQARDRLANRTPGACSPGTEPVPLHERSGKNPPPKRCNMMRREFHACFTGCAVMLISAERQSVQARLGWAGPPILPTFGFPSA